MKKFLSSIIFIGITQVSICQNSERIYFTDWGSQTTQDSAKYYVEWAKEDSIDIRTGYYLADGKLKFIERYSENVKKGKSRYYHANGKLECEIIYHNDHPIGTVKSYYPNGSLHYEEIYDSAESTNQINSKQMNYGIIQYYDSVGNWLVKNGNGIDYEYVNSRYGYSKAKGNIVNGLKDSIWVARFANGKQFYTEKWRNGTLVNGKSFWHDDSEYNYDVMEKQAEPIGGMKTFYNYVGGIMRYPRDARRAGIEGRVFIEFIVNRDGSFTDVKVLRGIGGGCDEEALRVIKSAPRWTPGLQRGRPVRSKFNLAIIFKLT